MRRGLGSANRELVCSKFKETPLQVAPGSVDCQISATLPSPAAAACHYSTQGLIPTNDNAHHPVGISKDLKTSFISVKHLVYTCLYQHLRCLTALLEAGADGAGSEGSAIGPASKGRLD